MLKERGTRLARTIWARRFSDYVGYAQIKNASRKSRCRCRAAKGIDDVKARLRFGRRASFKADSMVADIMTAPLPTTLQVMAGQNKPSQCKTRVQQRARVCRMLPKTNRKRRARRRTGTAEISQVPKSKARASLLARHQRYAKNAAAQTKYAGKGASRNVGGGRQKHAVVHHAPRSANLSSREYG